MNTSHETALQAPNWMRTVLIAAGVYNLAWGGFAILSPMSIFRWSGFDPLPLYPEFWQCIGMIVGVYGIGYLAAARDAYRHWPIVLVGLLGKIFGPIGFLGAIIEQRLPTNLGWTILTNDLIWWVPFAAMLFGAARAAQTRNADIHPETGDPLTDLLSQKGQSLQQLSRGQNVLVIFLRHAGCTFCREALADIEQQREQIALAGAIPVIVHMSSEESAAAMCGRFGCSDLHRISDPECRLYRRFSLPLGGFRQLLGPRTWIRGAQAFFKGYGVGRLEGNGFQMPGTFLIRDGQVLREFRHAAASTRPNYVSLACDFAKSDAKSANDATRSGIARTNSAVGSS